MANLTQRPDQPVVSLRDAMNQLFSEAFTPAFGSSFFNTNGSESMPINVYEDGEKFYLHVLLPAADLGAVDVTAANGVLSITARQEQLAAEGWRQVWQEFTPREYRRQLRLPVEFDPNQIEASYRNGVLLITVPKAEHTRPRQIKIQVGK